MRRILLVEDNPDHAQIALRALRPLGDVDYVRRAGEAVERTHDRAYDLVVLDYRLPDLTGLDVAQVVRKATSAPIVLMTAQGSEEVAKAALAIPGVQFLVKDAQFGKRLAFEAAALLEGAR